jgi:hypothetical protein
MRLRMRLSDTVDLAFRPGHCDISPAIGASGAKATAWPVLAGSAAGCTAGTACGR